MSKFHWIANNTALDFANTLVADANGNKVELLAAFDDLLAWVVEGGLTQQQGADRVQALLNASQKKKMMSLAADARDEMKALARAQAGGRPVPRSVINKINEIMRGMEGHFEIVQTRKGYERKFKRKMGNVTDFLLPIAEAAIELLCYAEPGRVKKCQGRSCVLYFYDATKPGRRRWCTTSGCGNRAKAKAHYERSKGTENR